MYYQTNCPLCGSERISLFARWVDQGFTLNYRICTECGLVFMSPRMTDAELEEFYLVQYRITQQGTEGPTPRKIAFERKRAAHLLDIIQIHAPEVNVHLDVGCAAGELLLSVQSQYGCSSIGVEPSRSYKEYNDSLGLEVYQSLDDLYGMQSPPKVDLVTISHVLEHFPDPVQELSRIRENLLVPGGYLLVEVPNLFVHISFELGHLYAYYRRTLQLTLEKAGFRVLWHKLHGIPRSDPRPHYLTVIAEEAADRSSSRMLVGGVHPKLIQLKRRYGRSLISLALGHPVFFISRAVARFFRHRKMTDVKGKY